MSIRGKVGHLRCCAGATLAGAARAGRRRTGRLDEITVTAQGREERLQATPATITAPTSEQVERLGITNTQDVARAVSNLQMLPLTANP